MRLSSTRVYDLPLILGIPVGVVVGLIFGELLPSIGLGFAIGNLATYGLRYQSGSMTPTLPDRWRSRHHGARHERQG